MSLLKYIPHAMAIVLAIVVSIGFFNFKALENDVSYWRGEAINNSSLFYTADSIAGRRAQELDKLKLDNKGLQKSLNDQGEKIRSLTDINGELKSALANVNTDPIYITVVDSDSVEARSFTAESGPFGIKGYFLLKAPWTITFEEIKAKVDLQLALTEDKHGAWRAYVTSKDTSFTIADLVPQVSPYQKSFMEKLNFGLGAFAGPGQFGVVTSVYYDKHSVNLLMNTQGGAIGYSRTFSIK